MSSGRETIGLKGRAHKPADSVLVVGKGTRFCSLQDVSVRVVKQRFKRVYAHLQCVMVAWWILDCGRLIRQSVVRHPCSIAED